MNNYEFYQKEIIEFIRSGHSIAKKNDRLCACSDLDCEDCDFGKIEFKCARSMAEWLEQEYKLQEIDWTKVPKFTKVWVRDQNNSDWRPNYFLKVYPDGRFFTTCYGEHTHSGNSGGLCKYCKLDDSVDPIPYLKED